MFSSPEENLENFFTEEDMLSSFYRRRNEKDEAKRVKFLVFSSLKPATDLDEHFYKRKQVDSNHDKRDVDLLYLKKKLIDRYAAKPENEDHLEIYQNIKDTELFKEVIASLEKDEDLWKYDSFVFVFLTYISPKGLENGETKIHFYNSEVTLEKIWDRVGNIKAMRGKPKVFLVQADDVWQMQEPPRKTKAEPFRVPERKIPTDADRLTILSMIPGKHFVEGDNPSFLIQAFAEVLNENENAKEQLDMLSLTVLINQKVFKLIESSTVRKTKNQKDQLQLPITTSTLRKLWLP